MNKKTFEFFGVKVALETQTRDCSAMTISMGTTNHLQHPLPWPSSKGVSSPSPWEHCLFCASFTKEATINHLLSHSVSSPSWRHHNDALWEGMWGCLHVTSPGHAVPFNKTPGQARPHLCLGKMDIYGTEQRSHSLLGILYLQLI